MLPLLLVAWAASHPCRDCHPAQTAAFLASPMGRSFGAVAATGRREFRDGGSVFVADGARHSLTRNAISATREATYRIGSGQHALGFLVKIAGELFQSPIAEYPREGRAGLAPGYERITHPDFNRRVTGECLFCHTNGAHTQSPESIGCERCHGRADSHLQRPTRQNILHPSRLAAAEREAICEQCHLAGEVRIAEPGRSLASYQPGDRLEDHFTVFVYDQPRGDLRVISHAEQLARSRCAPRLTCTTCHAVHGQAVQVNRVCRGCHQQNQPGHPPGDHCAQCHMPRRPVSDGAHTVFTDHRIAPLGQRPADVMPGKPAGLRPWRQAASPDRRQRNTGLALIAAGERDRRPDWIQEGYKQLRAVFPRYERDPEVLAAIGMVLFLKDQYPDAAKLLRAAVALRPGDAALQERLAAVLRAAGDRPGAALALERAIALDPLRETAYHLLHEIRPEAKALERYLQVNPQSVIAREALRR